jgi:hypothetical protein
VAAVEVLVDPADLQMLVDPAVEVLVQLQELFIVVAQVHLDKVMLVVLDIIIVTITFLEAEVAVLIQLVQTPHKLHLVQVVLEEMV